MWLSKVQLYTVMVAKDNHVRENSISILYNGLFYGVFLKAITFPMISVEKQT